MTVRGKHRGHEIIFKSQWLYADNQSPVSDNPERRCGHCNKPQTPEGHDGCLGTLPNVRNACCGHGEDDLAYVQFWDGSDIRGKDAVEYQQEVIIERDHQQQ